MNLSLGAIFTVKVVYSYVIWGQELAEELSAIRPTRRISQLVVTVHRKVQIE